MAASHERGNRPIRHSTRLQLTIVACLLVGGCEDPAPPPIPTTVTITPGTVALEALGQSVQLVATVHDEHGRVMADAAVVWSSSVPAAVSVTSGGLATADANGQATITARAGSAEGSAQISVDQLPVEVGVSPAAPVLPALGDTVRLTGRALDANGYVIEDPPAFVWGSGDQAVAPVDTTGLVTAAANGETQITATTGGAVGTATVTVTQVADSVVVSPPTDTILPGDTLVLVARAFDANGHVVPDAVFEWASGDPAVARVSETGLARGIARGTTTIMAMNGTAQGFAELVVLAHPDRDLLVALYEATDGANWQRNGLWLSGEPVGNWAGVNTDEYGRVVWLYLEYNDLSGPIPPELGNLASLETLDLGSNYLSGPIPPELGNLGSLRWLVVGNNDLSGPIPSELGNLDNLTGLGLSTNNLSGAIPPELGNLASLETLYLSSNELSGPIPSELGSLASLTSLYLQGNELSGPIPSELGNIFSLTRLGLWKNNLSGPIPPELGNLVSLETLYLSSNELSGPIPPELGNLVSLETLHLSSNELSGPIPPELRQIASLSWLNLEQTKVCVPGTRDFVAWLGERTVQPLNFCNAADIQALQSLYEAAGGSNWALQTDWHGLGHTVDPTDHVLGDWFGVHADSLGRVAALDLANNGLVGKLPTVLGELAHLTSLRVGGNGLSGRLPLSLTRLPLREFRYSGTDLCLPVGRSFQAWLDSIPVREGTDEDCEALTDREILELLYEATSGPASSGPGGWTRSDNWLTDAPLGEWHGVRTDSDGRVTRLVVNNNNLSGPIPAELGSLSSLKGLSLQRNDLSGPIPPELGSLSSLKVLSLNDNNLSGPIPPELGNLDSVTSLSLSDNDLLGQIPPELGNLGSLRWLSLRNNDLSGSIPPELGNLASLTWLGLVNNDLSGPIPSELGNLDNLTALGLVNNDLSGPIPSELGNLDNLTALWLSTNDLSGATPSELGNLDNLTTMHLDNNALSGPISPEFGRLLRLVVLRISGNPELAGALPIELAAMTQLRALVAHGTRLCVQANVPEVRSWIRGMDTDPIDSCTPAALYLTQAVQTRHDTRTVPLIAGERALLRVFLVAARQTAQPIPNVRARFYLGDREVEVIEIPGKAAAIPTEVDEGLPWKSVNAEVPAGVVQPGLEVVIEVDSVDASLGVPRRIPASGRLGIPVRVMPVLDLTLVPFLWSEDPDSAIISLIEDMADDPEGHELLDGTRSLLPVGELEASAHEAVTIGSNSGYQVLHATSAIRAAEGGTGHYMGMMSWFSDVGGVAWRPGRTSASVPISSVIAHELGHNMSLGHAPCGAQQFLDPYFPDPRGRIGSWGYDFRTGRLVRPNRPDVMSYCRPEWISGYHFNKALRHRLEDEGGESAANAAAVPSLLLWGGADSDGRPHLEPGFVVDAPPALPQGGGDHVLRGASASGTELFSLWFDMPELADAEGRSSFAFVLPTEPGWGGELAEIMLSGPGGTAVLDSRTHRPSALVRNAATGQVRAILLDLPQDVRSHQDASALLGIGPAFNVRFSQGVPGAAAWLR